MLAIVLRRGSLAFTLLALAMSPLLTPTAAAQAPGCSSCAASQAVALPVQPAMQPVFQTQYRSVPVTTLRPVTQTVQRPVAYTEYVNQPYTQYVPVSQPVTRQVQSVQYRNVTNYRTVHRDMGRWVTRYQPINRLNPYQIDPRPGIAGWMNRTAFSVRNSLTPRMATSRRYVPNVVAQTIPVQSRVAVPAVRNVTQMVTRMVPRQSMRRVAVNRVRYETATVTQMQPTVAYRNVPIAPTMAWAPSSVSSAYAPIAPQTVAMAPAPQYSQSYSGPTSISPTVVGSAVTGSSPYSSAFGSGLAYEVIDDRPVNTALSPEPDTTIPRAASNDDKYDDHGIRRKRDNIIDDTDTENDEFIRPGNEFGEHGVPAHRTSNGRVTDRDFATERLKDPYEKPPVDDLPARRNTFSGSDNGPFGGQDDVPMEEDAPFFDTQYDGLPGKNVSETIPANGPATSPFKRSPPPAEPEKTPFGNELDQEFNSGDLPPFEGGAAAKFRRSSRPHAMNTQGTTRGNTQLVSRASRSTTTAKTSKSAKSTGWRPSRLSRRPLPKVSGPKLTFVSNRK